MYRINSFQSIGIVPIAIATYIIARVFIVKELIVKELILKIIDNFNLLEIRISINDDIQRCGSTKLIINNRQALENLSIFFEGFYKLILGSKFCYSKNTHTRQHYKKDEDLIRSINHHFGKTISDPS